MENNIHITDIWGIADAELNNARASLQKFPTEQSLINNLIKLYKEVPDSFNKVYPRGQIPVLSMFWTCFRGLLVSIQLVLQGHIPESYAITSKSAETVAISRKFILHPHMIKKWIKRNKEEDQPFRRLLGELFPRDDKVLQPEVYGIYELTSEHGRHPNFSSTVIYSNFNKITNENTVFYSINDFEDKINYRRNLNYIIFAYHRFLIAFSKIFDKFLKKEWLQELEVFNKSFESHKHTLRELFEYEYA